MENVAQAQPQVIEESKLRKLIKQFAKFFVIGIINTVVDLTVLNIETVITGAKDGYPYSVQKGVSFLVAVTMSYFMNKHWTFQDGEKQGEGKKFSQFIFVSIIGMIINIAVSTVVVTYLQPVVKIGFLTPQLWVNIGALSGTAIGLFWNFVGYKFWVFKK